MKTYIGLVGCYIVYSFVEGTGFVFVNQIEIENERTCLRLLVADGEVELETTLALIV